MTPLQPFGHYFRDMAGNQHFHTGATPPSFAHSEITPLYAHPSRGVVDEDVVARAVAAMNAVRSWNPDVKDDYVRKLARAALQAAALPADTVTVQEAWEWAGGNPGITATRADLEAALRDLDAVCDEADAALPAVPDGPEWWRPDARVIELAHRLVASGPKAAHVSASETHEISEFILSLTAATPAHDQPEGGG